MEEEPLGRSNLLHVVLFGLYVLEKVPTWILGVVLALLTLPLCISWQWVSKSWTAALLAGALYVAAVIADRQWLLSLPRLRLSFGPVKPPLVGLMLVRWTLSWLPLVGCAVGLAAATATTVDAVIQIALSALVVYSTAIEPFRLKTTRIEIHTPKLPIGERVRLVQVSDLHVERVTRRERALVARLKELSPDYVLLTGDYLNLSYIGEPRAIAEARQVLRALCDVGMVYAVSGTHHIDPDKVVAALFDDLTIRWLRDEHVTIQRDGYALTFAGAGCTRDPEVDSAAVARALAGVNADSFIVLLFHSPEMAEEASRWGTDLYLAGHTHGGQIRLPFYGALITATNTGKQYEMGRYQVNGMTMYVSRGIGMEGMAAPRARFLCPPEIVCIDLFGQSNEGSFC